MLYCTTLHKLHIQRIYGCRLLELGVRGIKQDKLTISKAAGTMKYGINLLEKQINRNCIPLSRYLVGTKFHIRNLKNIYV